MAPPGLDPGTNGYERGATIVLLDLEAMIFGAPGESLRAGFRGADDNQKATAWEDFCTISSNSTFEARNQDCPVSLPSPLRSRLSEGPTGVFVLFGPSRPTIPGRWPPFQQLWPRIRVKSPTEGGQGRLSQSPDLEPALEAHSAALSGRAL